MRTVGELRKLDREHPDYFAKEETVNSADLDELERLHRNATPGPWRDEPCHWGKSGISHVSVHHSKPAVRDIVHAYYGVEFADGQLIVAMRNALPALLSAARREARLREALTTAAKHLELAARWATDVAEPEISEHARAAREALAETEVKA